MISSNLESNQYTLRRAVNFCGIGLHSGFLLNMTIKPAPVDSGIMFSRVDLKEKPSVLARMDNIVNTKLATTIGNDDVTVSTTEHILAALYGVGIDNALVELDGNEVPIMDGSAGPFVRSLAKGGRKKQTSLRKIIKFTHPVSISNGVGKIRIEPWDGFKITERIDFADNLISEQNYSIELTRKLFCQEIAWARTFGFVEQVEALWKNGLALGGNLNNVVAIHWDGQSVLNEGGLRFEDEFVRHKLLDLVGDMALLGYPVMGHVLADCSGHGLHRQLMKAIVDNPGCWELVSMGDNPKNSRGRVAGLSAGFQPVLPFPSFEKNMFQPA